MNLHNLEQDLTLDEGKKLNPYRDSRNLWTIFIGRCLETNPLTGAEWKFLLDNNLITIAGTDAGAKYVFDCDVKSAVTQIMARCDFWDKLNDVRQNVLIELCFQLGINRLLGFNKMFAALRIGNWDEAAKELLDSDMAREEAAAARDHLPHRALKQARKLRGEIV